MQAPSRLDGPRKAHHALAHITLAIPEQRAPSAALAAPKVALSAEQRAPRSEF
jgi:hypothetical protein